MNTISRSLNHVRHIAGPKGKPLCGGGNGAKTSQFETDFEDANCKACVALKKRQPKLVVYYRGVHAVKFCDPTDARLIWEVTAPENGTRFDTEQQARETAAKYQIKEGGYTLEKFNP